MCSLLYVKEAVPPAKIIVKNACVCQNWISSQENSSNVPHQVIVWERMSLENKIGTPLSHPHKVPNYFFRNKLTKITAVSALLGAITPAILTRRKPGHEVVSDRP